MKPKEALAYLTGWDYLEKHSEYRRKLLTERTGVIPDFKTIGKVLVDGIGEGLVGPFVVASRFTGIDFALKKVRQQLAKEK